MAGNLPPQFVKKGQKASPKKSSAKKCPPGQKMVFGKCVKPKGGKPANDDMAY